MKNKSKKLRDKVIISTRPLSADDKISELLIKENASVIKFPMIEITENELTEKEQRLLFDINSFDYLIFTSANGIIYFFEYLKKNNIQLEKTKKIAVIGKKTAIMLKNYNFSANYISKGKTSGNFLEEINSFNIVDKKILLILGNLAKNLLEEGINNNNIDRVNIYKTTIPQNVNSNTLEIIYKNNYDLIIFTSPSGFHNFAKLISPKIYSKLKIACIGETTAKAIKKYGIVPKIVSPKPNVEQLTKEIIHYLE